MKDLEVIRVVRGRGLLALDQTLLPHEETVLELGTVEAICEAIVALRVRGAPLLGVVGAGAMAVAGETLGTGDGELTDAAKVIKATRPTAVDLGWAVDEALRRALARDEGARRQDALWDWAEELLARRLTEDRAIGAAGAALLAPGTAVLTHCNTGALATGGIGTALGVVRTAWEEGRLSRCYATETRPLLQGARLTAWELTRAGIPATLLPDTAAAALLASGLVGAVVVGADRIAANGDSANKIGTLGLALAAADARVPFYVAAPASTIDLACPDGAAIPIEFRDGGEVGGFGRQRWAPEGVAAWNPAFDVTPARLITAIITERGVVGAPFAAGLARVVTEAAGAETG